MNKFKRFAPLILILAIIVVLVSIGTVSAYMFQKATAVNELEKAVVTCVVNETFDGDKKSSIKVENTGNVNEYLRVRLVPYWADSEGNTVGKPAVMPEVSYDTDNWIFDSAENTYYCKVKVAPGDETPELLKAPIVLTESTYPFIIPETVRQVVVVIAEAVQAEPDTAVADMWGAAVANGVITSIS